LYNKKERECHSGTARTFCVAARGIISHSTALSRSLILPLSPSATAITSLYVHRSRAKRKLGQSECFPVTRMRLSPHAIHFPLPFPRLSSPLSIANYMPQRNILRTQPSRRSSAHSPALARARTKKRKRPSFSETTYSQPSPNCIAPTRHAAAQTLGRRLRRRHR
jgi:hypothetical protein